MKVRPIIIIALVLTSMIAGCSYHYDIVAVAKSGSILFEPGSKKGTGCFADFSVTDPRGKIVWKVSAPEYLSPPCDDKFPITYGKTPNGMTEEVKASPLRPGVTYRVEGWDGDSYSGLFRFRQGIIVDVIPEHQ